jgi:heme A synthase
VGVLTTVLAVWLWRAEPRRWVRGLGWLGLAAVVVQAVLGGITVLYRLPTPIVVFHASLAQLFFCGTLSLAVFTGRSWNLPVPQVQDRQSPQFRHLAAATSGALIMQLVLGAALRHHALDVIPHVLGALVVSLLVGWTVVRAMSQLPEQKPLQRLAATMGILLIVQLALGGVSYLTRTMGDVGIKLDAIMIWTTTAHVATGAAVLGTSWVLTLLSFRRLSAPRAIPAMQHNPQKSTA